MSIVQFDSQKIEQLLNSATSERQRKMYQALLDKARSHSLSSTNSKTPETTPETEKKAQTLTNQKTETKTKTKTKTKTTKKQKKETGKSATTEADSVKAQKTTPVEETPKLTQEKPDVPPQTELESLSKEPQQQPPDKETPIFQALGVLILTPYIKDNLLKVTIDEGEYDLLYVPGSQSQAHKSLKAKLEKNGSDSMFLKLYPNATFDRKSMEPKLSFFLANFSSHCEKINDHPKGFVLRGIWQYIPQCKSTVISIHRNISQLAAFKKLKSKQQFYFAQPRHIPVVWDAPVEPFKFNPQLEKGEQMPRYFVEVRAIFKDGLYVVEEMLREPTLKIPKFIKVSKKKQPSVEKGDQKSESSATT